MRRFAIESEIPAGHPDKLAIEASIREAFAGAVGSWRAGILVLRDAPWWVVFVHERERGFKRSALLDTPRKQRPDAIKSVVSELLQERRQAPRTWPAPRELRTASARGTVFLNTIDFVRSSFGPDAHNGVLWALAADPAATFRGGIEEGSWEPLDHLVAYMEAAKASLAPKEPEFFEAMGRFGARHSRMQAARALVQGPAPALDAIVGLWPTFFDVGELSVADEDPGGATLRVRAFPTHRSLCRRLQGSLQGLLGDAPVRLEERACVADGDLECELHLEWRRPPRRRARRRTAV